MTKLNKTERDNLRNLAFDAIEGIEISDYNDADDLLLSNSHLNEELMMVNEREQLSVCMEECAELIQAISKCVRYEDDKYLENLIEEIADVRICLEYLIAYVVNNRNYDFDLYTAVSKKVLRNCSRLIKNLNEQDESENKEEEK